MKLIDILARELKVWPEDSDGEVGQCSNGQLHGISNRHFKSIELKHCFTVSEDYFSGRVSEAQWLNAVMALEVENVNFNDPMKNNGPVAAEWNGEGLPPVRTVCLTTDRGRDFEVRILAYADKSGRQAVMVEDATGGVNQGELHSWMAHMCDFRPILSAEQIEAEERLAGIKEIERVAKTGEHLDIPMRSATALWDAGYRKQVAK